MIFIAGVSPKTVTLDGEPLRCPVCGLHQARFKRIDHWLSLFFIPVLRVKKGEPFLMCDRCQHQAREFPEAALEGAPPQKACPHCGQPVQEAFVHCPWCGKRL